MQFLARIASWSNGHPWLAVGLVTLLTLGMGGGFAQAESGRVIDQFIPDDLAAAATQDRIAELFGDSELAFIMILDDPGEPALLRTIIALDAALESESDVQDVSSVADFLEDGSDDELRTQWEALQGRPDVAGPFIREDATLLRVAFRTGLEPETITRILDDADTGDHDAVRAGLAYVEVAQQEGGAQDVQILVPLSVLAIAILLAVLFRRPSDVIIPIATTFVALAWAYGTLAWAQMPLTPLVFSVMPLILGLGVDYMLHIVYAFRATQGPSPKRFFGVGRRVGAPVFFTALTTLIGFGSFLVSKIPQVRSWGLLIGSGALYAFILGFLLLPALYRWSRPGKRRQVATHKVLGRLGLLLVRRRILVLVTLAIITLGFGAAATQVDLERTLEAETDPEDPAAQALASVESRFGGQSIIQFLIPSDVGASAVDDVTTAVQETPGIGFVDSPATRAPGATPYPSSDPRLDGVSVPEAWLVTAGYATEDERQILPALEAIAAQHGVDITGRGLIQVQAEGAVLDSLLLSTGVAFILVFIFLMVVFRNPWIALLAFTPLVLVLIWQLGIQALTGIPLNSVTGITSAMVIGIGVDYSVHLMSDIRRGRGQGVSRHDAAVNAVRHVGQPVLAATLSTVAAFTILSFSQFSQLSQFGTVAAIVVACAFVASIAFLPAATGRAPRAVAHTQPTSQARPSNAIARPDIAAKPWQDVVRPRFTDPEVQDWFEDR